MLVAGLFPNKLEFNVDVVVVFAPNILGVLVVTIYTKSYSRITDFYLLWNLRFVVVDVPPNKDVVDVPDGKRLVVVDGNFRLSI